MFCNSEYSVWTEPSYVFKIFADISFGTDCFTFTCKFAP